MITTLTFILGTLLGAAVCGWLVWRNRGRKVAALNENIAALQDNLVQARENAVRLEAQVEAHAEREADAQQHIAALKESFESIASKALRENSTQFLELAKTRLDTSEKHATAELEKKEEAVQAMLRPLAENLEKLSTATNSLEGKREKAYGELNVHLQQLMNATTHLSTNSTTLANVLKGSSQARGRWGEIALRNIAEMAGMTVHCDFSEQTTDNDGNRPDMIVRLPGQGIIPVDSKAPMADYERAVQETDPAQRDALLKSHAAALRTQVRALMRKDYGANLDGEIDFTVMFVPSEPMLSAAFEHDPGLLDEALQNRVLVSSPVTLIALLRTVGIYWKQEQMAENAQHIWDAASTLYERLSKFSDHLAKTGKGLESAVKAYNQTVGTYTARVIPAARKVEELGIESAKTKELEEIAPLEAIPRELT